MAASASRHGAGVVVLLDDHRDVAGRHGLAVEHRPAGQQGGDVGGEVLGDVGRRCLIAIVLWSAPNVSRLTTRSRNGSLCGAPARRRPWCCASTSRTTMRRVAEFGAAQHRLQAVDERLVAAPVVPEGLLVAGGVRGLQVGDDVAAAERVDGLLGIADQDHRRVAAERPVDDLPLHRVGVLELVDHHDRPALPHPVPGRRVRRSQGLWRAGSAGRRNQERPAAVCGAPARRGPRRRSRVAPPRGVRRAGPAGAARRTGRRRPHAPARARPGRSAAGRRPAAPKWAR